VSDIVLIVDDEDGVRRTFVEWLKGAGLPVTVLAAADAEEALLLANQHPIDLAVLDWNLGSGSDGLRLLEDLVEFRPDLVAILVTGYAARATPLEALRKGVRDYLDKNHELTRETFLNAVVTQLQRIGPVKRQRQLNDSLARFRAAVESVLPTVRGAAALNDPVPFPDGVRALFRFALTATGAPGGLVVARAADGTALGVTSDGIAEPSPILFSRTLAAGVLGLQEPAVTTEFSGVELLPAEQNRSSVLAVPLAGGVPAVLELFDRPFTAADKHLARALAEVGGALLKQSEADRRSAEMLATALQAALAATDDIGEVMQLPALPESVRHGLQTAPVDSAIGLEIVEAARRLSQRHGSTAVQYIVTMVDDLRVLLDAAAGEG
jgi:two-component system, NtrC family, nitrogen regulation response regulator NtrX